MKAGWNTKSFEESIERVTYTHKIQRKDFLDDGAYPIVSQEEDFINGYWDNKADLFNVVTPVVVFGDHTKVLKFVDFDFVLGADGVKILQPCEFLEPKFFFYQLQTANLDSLGYARHYKLLKGLEISYPSRYEQQRIVGILDAAFDSIATAKATAEQNLQNARALFESHLQSVFTQGSLSNAEGRGKGWIEKPLGEVCDLLNGFAFKSGDVVSKSKTQLVRMGNLYGNRLSLDRSPVFYPDSFAVNYQRYLLKEGDLIMSLTGTTGKEDYGYAVRIPYCGHELLMNQRIAKFDLIRLEVVNLDYLFYYLRSRVFLDMLYPTANGTRQANLSSVTIKTLPIPLCSIREQKRIASALDEIADDSQRLESLYQRKLATLDELKKSLLHQAFSGAL